MRLYPTKNSGWHKISKELLLLIGLGLLLLLTAGFAAASRLGDPAGLQLDDYSFLSPANGLAPEAVIQSNYALQFDGSDDYARVLNVGNFDFTTTFTLEAWVKPDTVTSDGTFEAFINGRVFDDPTGTSGGWMMYLPINDHSRWGMFLCTIGCTSFLGPSSSLAAGEWVHVAATYDGAIIKIYKDGVLANSAAHSGDVSEMNYIFFGASSGTFDGVIDEVRIWDIARTAEEIRSTMIGSLQGDEAGLVGYWPLDDGTGQFATDATGNGQLARLGSANWADEKDPTWVASDSPIIPPFFQLVPFLAGLNTDIGITSIFAPGFGCGWVPGETVDVWWDDPEIQLATFTVDAMGCFEGQFPLADERVGSSKPGTHEVQARGGPSGVVTSTFELVVPQLHLDPAQGPSQTVVSVSGCGWDGASTVNIYLQLQLPPDPPLLTTPVDSSTGCIDDTLKIPNKKDGLHGLIAFSDLGSLVSGAGYWVRDATIVLTPNEGPAGARVPLTGCGWFSEEQIDFAFTANGQTFDTWGTSLGGCITTGGPTDPTLSIPITATLGAKTIQASGRDSGHVVNVPFTVVERSLAFDPDN